MTDDDVDVRRDEAARVSAWRTLQLVDAGVDPDAAIALAATRLDVRTFVGELAELRARGCPPETALAILWPDER